jgi:ABC-type Na+ transport system ATPase subunit NatA
LTASAISRPIASAVRGTGDARSLSKYPPSISSREDLRHLAHVHREEEQRDEQRVAFHAAAGPAGGVEEDVLERRVGRHPPALAQLRLQPRRGALEPEVLFLDEPTTGLDPASRLTVGALMLRSAASSSSTSARRLSARSAASPGNSPEKPRL